MSIGADAIEILREQRGKVFGEYVFPSPNGGPISPDSVLHMLHRVLERAGLPKIRFHDLRHYSAGFTLDTYAHVTTAAQKEAAKTMGNLLGSSIRSFPRDG